MLVVSLMRRVLRLGSCWLAMIVGVSDNRTHCDASVVSRRVELGSIPSSADGLGRALGVDERRLDSTLAWRRADSDQES